MIDTREAARHPPGHAPKEDPQDAEQKALAINAHKEWLKQPLTKTLLVILKRQSEIITSSIMAANMDRNVDSEHIRRLAVQLTTTNKLTNIVYDTETFIAKSSAS